MDIAALSIGMSQMKVQQQVDVSLLKKVMDTSGQKTEFIDKMLDGASVKNMEMSVQPHLGSSIDITL
ncbi:YjfB family protein [Salipaludibacillus agaradhaerens]|uniref:YjfB family protein n=1 Tax=Salipaludibacillus agaradhaerens TaxID=76935 RepID=UPI002151AEFF|nr:YjfB family protein [Salipaludibacillus agaradhaerens]MCR6105753.1 YjfB family protein [Salipaludibacillus agaradhaerens]MCR6117789.1 YjfB family protein [Salipaludibacillus agaradhaerens]UJW56956.1 YjfB family protein [Bacillus sp. A116_S68]